METTYRFLGQYEDLPLKAMDGLLSDLSESKIHLDDGVVRGALAQDGFYLLLAEIGNRLIGIATLQVSDFLMRRKGRIEDVVVRASYRGKGVGKTLVGHLISKAHLLGVNRLELTSRRERVAANKLYPSLGFVQPESNYYRMELG